VATVSSRTHLKGSSKAMLALEAAPTDEAVYKELHAFNKLILNLDPQTYLDPRATPAAEFHDTLLQHFPSIQEEVKAHAHNGMAMCDLDDIQHAMLGGSPQWRVLWIKAFGEAVDNPLPVLTAIVAAHPEIFNVMVSRLRPGAELPLHTGPFKGVLRYHLGLEVPRGEVGLEVRGQEYTWGEGRGVVFDDTHMHRAWNRTPHDRVVLFADVLRQLPEPLRSQRDALLTRLAASDGLAKIRQSIATHTT